MTTFTTFWKGGTPPPPAMSTPRILSNLRNGPHDLEIIEILIGSLLGDGSMERPSNDKNTNACLFSFYQEKTHGEYLLWLHGQLVRLGYTKENIPQIQSRMGLNNNLRYYFRFRSFSYTSLNWLYVGFFKTLPDGKRVKIIPTFVEEYLSPRVLAVWLMDDGTYHKNKGIRFCTNGFTLNEIKFLGSILLNKFGFSYSIHKTGSINQYGLYIPKGNLEKLITLIKPYMHPSMYYKLGL